MTLIWDNPLGHDIVAIQRCRACGTEETRTLAARPMRVAGEDSLEFAQAEPLTLQDGARILDREPFRCTQCGNDAAALVSIALDEGTGAVH